MTLGRRLTTAWVRFSEFKHWNSDVARLLDDVLRAINAKVHGLPEGFFGTVPSTIKAGETGTAGTEAAGWMSAGARPAIETGPPTGLANANAEGTGTSLMRAGARIKRDVRVFKDGVEVATRNALDIRGLTVTDDPGNDRVVVTAGASSSSGAGGQDMADYQLRQMVDSYALRKILSTTFR